MRLGSLRHPPRRTRAQMAELVDALVSGTSAARRGGSSPLLGTRGLFAPVHWRCRRRLEHRVSLNAASLPFHCTLDSFANLENIDRTFTGDFAIPDESQ